MTTSYKRNLAKFVIKRYPDAIEKTIHGGAEYRFRCPFCGGGRTKEVSFDINIEKGTGHCWRAKCGWSGTSNWFVSQVLNISPKEAYELLAGDVEVSIEALMLEVQELQAAVQSRFNLPDEVVNINSFNAFWESSEFLSESDQEDIIEDWVISRGFQPDEFFQTHELFLPPDLPEWRGYVAIVVETNNAKAYLLYLYDLSRLSDSPKTRNPPGDVLSSMLYNYNNIKDSDKPLFIVEGFFDAARLISWGYNAVCIFGTNLSDYQAYLISRTRCDEVCVLLDYGADDKAKLVVAKLAEQCYEKEITRVHISKPGADPDSISEEEFFSFYRKRTRYVNEFDQVKKKLMKAMNEWN